MNHHNYTIDIHSRGEYPSDALSNFAEHPFKIDGVACSSMEGFLQSLKFQNPNKQREICLLSGKEAKVSAKNSFSQLRWRCTKTLYWQGRKIRRFSDDYQKLLDKAYDELGKNLEFATALKTTGHKKLTHSIGEQDMRKTVLTEYEFLSRLKRIRRQLREQQ